MKRKVKWIFPYFIVVLLASSSGWMEKVSKMEIKNSGWHLIQLYVGHEGINCFFLDNRIHLKFILQYFT